VFLRAPLPGGRNCGRGAVDAVLGGRGADVADEAMVVDVLVATKVRLRKSWKGYGHARVRPPVCKWTMDVKGSGFNGIFLENKRKIAVDEILGKMMLFTIKMDQVLLRKAFNRMICSTLNR
jgi:hypothetical protein